MPSALEVCLKGLSWAERQDYRGYAKGDALNSPVLRAIAGESRLLRSGFVYTVSRFPINLRPLLGVQKSLNPKAMALFARASFHVSSLTNDETWVSKGIDLLDHLLRLSQIDHFSAHCWGAEYPRASPKLGPYAYFPGAVITCEVAEAFLDAFATTRQEKYLDVARSATRFITRDLSVLEESADKLCYSYVPGHSWKVVNSNAKTACLLAGVASVMGDDDLMSKARANMRWVIDRQTPSGAWFYADPPESSHVKHDNYHTGFVLNSIADYIAATKDESWLDAYASGLRFYEDQLFLPNGAPKWRHDRVYPLDIKGASQGMICFSLASRFFPGKEAVARRTTKWVIDNMWDHDGRLYYQKGRVWKKKYTLMRWCQAWACYAFALLARIEVSPRGSS